MSKKSGVVVVPLDEQLLTLKETAAYFAVAEKTIERWVEQVPEFPKPIYLPSFERDQMRFYRVEIVAFKELLRTRRVKRINKKYPK